MVPQPSESTSSAGPTFEAELLRHQLKALESACFLSSALLAIFVALDYIALPRDFATLIAIRVVCCLALVGLGLGLRAGRIASARGVAMAAVGLVMVPLTTAAIFTTGPTSVYAYSALLPLAAAAILVPLGPRDLAVISVEVMVVILAPIALFHGPFDARAFWTLASILACMGVLTVAGTRQQDYLRRREFGMRHEAARQGALANLGLLAGGLAHDLASPLTALSLEVERLAASPEVMRLAGPRLEGLQRGTKRMRDVLDAMRGSARLSDGARVPVDLGKEIDAALTLVAPVLQNRAEIVRELLPIGPVACQSTQLGQVLVNLLLNALQAVEHATAPRIWVRLRAEGLQAIIEVEDNGPGVPEALRERIFEPLFTTKGEQGNGLGLWISAEIARAHEGVLTVHEGAAGGALFRLSLPRNAASRARLS